LGVATFHDLGRGRFTSIVIERDIKRSAAGPYGERLSYMVSIHGLVWWVFSSFDKELVYKDYR
jgi:hypothetical protein